MNKTEFEQGRRVRLLVAIDGGEYPAGATGYLNHWYKAADRRIDDWGVVFDQDEDHGHTVIRGTLDSGEQALVTDLVEPIKLLIEELSEDTQQLTAVVYSWDDLVIQHNAAVR